MLDVVPILLFQLVFLWLYLWRIVKLRPLVATAWVAAFLGIALVARQFKEPLNGSLTYAPALLTVIALAVYHFLYCQQERPALLGAVAAFALAFFFRSIDMLVCPTFPWGTHFLWHVFIATALYLSARALIVNQPVQAKANEGTVK